MKHIYITLLLSTSSVQSTLHTHMHPDSCSTKQKHWRASHNTLLDIWAQLSSYKQKKQIFIHTTNREDGGNRSTWRKPPTVRLLHSQRGILDQRKESTTPDSHSPSDMHFTHCTTNHQLHWMLTAAGWSYKLQKPWQMYKSQKSY